MLYLVGGVARAGKTTIAKKFLKDTGIPYFSLDYLMMSMSLGLPQLNIDTNSDDFIIAKQLVQVVDPLITCMIENKIDYLLEGVQLMPRHVSQLKKKYCDQIAACFVGFSEVDIQRKCSELLKYGHLSENNWLRGYSKDQLEREVQNLITKSIKIKNECIEYGITYFDINDNFKGDIDSIANYLKEMK